jgi:hypothetical protein
MSDGWKMPKVYWGGFLALPQREGLRIRWMAASSLRVVVYE